MPRVIAGELLEEGWLPPKAAARALGISVDQLEARHRRGEIKRKQVLPNTRLYLYAIDGARR
jgi:hypothetical protein